MIALIRYTAAIAVLSQRFLAPVLVFLALMGVLTVNGTGPLGPAYASPAMALLVSATWLAMAVAGLDDASQRAIVTVNAGTSLKVLTGTVGTVLLGCLLLAGLGLIFPLLTGDYEVAPVDFVVGLEAQLTAACTGTAIGLVCSRRVFRRQGYAVVTAVALVLVMLLVDGMVPVNRLFGLMADADGSGDLLAPAAGMLAVAVAVLVAAVAATHRLAGRGE